MRIYNFIARFLVYFLFINFYFCVISHLYQLCHVVAISQRKKNFRVDLQNEEELIRVYPSNSLLLQNLEKASKYFVF